MTKWLSPAEAAEYADYSVDTIGDALRAGELRGFQRKPGGRWRITPDDIDAWLRGEEPAPIEIPRVTRTRRPA